MEENTRGLTITFMDGTKASYGFPQQGANAAAKQLKLEEFLKSDYVIVVADGTLTMFPVTNIKSIQLPLDPNDIGQVKLPGHTIRNATLTRGDI